MDAGILNFINILFNVAYLFNSKVATFHYVMQFGWITKIWQQYYEGLSIMNAAAAILTFAHFAFLSSKMSSKSKSRKGNGVSTFKMAVRPPS